MDTLYYDGHCALCHRIVRRLAEADAPGLHVRFSPLQGEHIRSTLSEEQRRGLPDSVVVHTADGRLLTRSDAALHVMELVGGRWRTAAKLMRWVPRLLRDPAYHMVSATRKPIFGRRERLCPPLRPGLRDRFLP